VPWPTWEEAGVAAVVSGLLYLVLRRLLPQSTLAGPGALEFTLIATLYAAWRLARQIPLGSNDDAIERARHLVPLEHALHLPTELSIQHFVLNHDWLGRPTTVYYAVMHVPALIGFLVWLFVRHRDRFPHWRNALAFVTAGCLAIRWIRVAPPRYLTDLGYQDLSEKWGPSVYGEIGSGVSDQFTAMPSIHVAWAAVVSFGIFMCTTSRWRWFFLLHVVITTLVVVATGHHWWMDGIVAVVLLAAGLALDTAVRRALAARRSSQEPSASNA
jgi:hypothetical protein